MTPLTLEHGGTEKWLGGGATGPGWGFSAPCLALLAQSISTFQCAKPGGDPAGAPDFPFGDLIIIRKDRVYSGSSFSGGSIIFQGRNTKFRGLANPGNPATSLLLGDPWWDLSQIVFQHYWQAWNGSALQNYYFSRINLFQDISIGPGSGWGYLNTKAQIQQIVDYAVSAGANLQLGTVDPEWNVPFYPVKAMTCAEALRICIGLVPDATPYFDHTTTPPTLHIRQRPNRTAVTLPYAGTDNHGRSHKSSDLTPLYDLVADEVVIQYQRLNQVDDKTYTQFDVDAAPSGSTGTNMGAIVIPIDLRGSNCQNVTGSVTSVAFDPTLDTFWKAKKPDLANATLIGAQLAVDTTINNATAPHDKLGIKIVDDTGADVSLTDFPNELTDGNVAKWMKLSGGGAVTIKPVTVKAVLSYTVKHPNNTNLPLETVVNHPVSVRLKLTNSPTGKHIYSAVKSYVAGDPAIVGLAAFIKDSLSQLQYEGTHTIIEKDVYQIISPGNVLNLSGGNSDWESMRAVIGSVSIDFWDGTTEISIGPEKHLDSATLAERLLLWRWRAVYDNPDTRNSGENQ